MRFFTHIFYMESRINLILKKSGFFALGWIWVLLMVSSCNHSIKNSEPSVHWDTLCVYATAYNSLNYQTNSGNPTLTAWGDTLKKNTKSIAVSRDLIEKGLTHNTPVKIQGFTGIFLVKDKMHARWKKKIDIYMGKNVKSARNFGKQELEIYYPIPNDTLSKKEK